MPRQKWLVVGMLVCLAGLARCQLAIGDSPGDQADPSPNEKGQIGSLASEAQLGKTEQPASTAADDDSDESQAGLDAQTDAPVEILWQAQFGTEDDDLAVSIVVDGNGNCYIAGKTDGRLGDSYARNYDAILVKYADNGEQQWIRQICTESPDSGEGIAVDRTGNCFIVGSTYLGLAGAGAGRRDIFLRKYDPDGSLLWEHQIGSSENDAFPSVAIDGEGNCYVSGHTRGNFAGPLSGESDILLIKYSADGEQLWARQFGSSGRDIAGALVVADDGIICIAGRTTGSMSGENHGGDDAFLLYLDNEGQWLSCDQFGTPGDDMVTGAAVDGEGNCYIVGQTEGDLAGGAGGYDVFIAKYDDICALEWLTQAGTQEADYATGIAIDDTNDLYVVGMTRGDLTGNRRGGRDAFLMKYDSQGHGLWRWQFGTPEDDRASAVIVDANGNCLVAGSTGGALAGDHQGRADAFIVVLSPMDATPDGDTMCK